MMTDQDRNAGTPASHAAAERPRLPSDDERRARFVSWIDRTTRHALRTALSGLLALLFVAGMVPEAGAQTTATPAGVCEGQTTEVTVSNVGNSNLSAFTLNTSVGSLVEGTDYWVVDSQGTIIQPNNSNYPITVANDSFSFRIRVADNVVTDSSSRINISNAAFYWNGSQIAVWDSTHSNCASSTSDGVTVSPTSLALTELGSSSTIEKTYTVVLDTDPGVDVTITATNGDATAVEVDTDAGTTGNQNTLTFTHGNSGNWNTAQTVTVRALNDADGANESFNITHAASAASGAYNGITVARWR